MLDHYTTKQLMVLFLGSKSLVEEKTEFPESLSADIEQRQQVLEAVNTYEIQKPEIFKNLATLSRALKERNFTHFKGWYDFSNWKNFRHFVMKVYDRRMARQAFSLN